jgi:hypothetical protein
MPWSHSLAGALFVNQGGQPLLYIARVPPHPLAPLDGHLSGVDTASSWYVTFTTSIQNSLFVKEKKNYLNMFYLNMFLYEIHQIASLKHILPV